MISWTAPFTLPKSTKEARLYLQWGIVAVWASSVLMSLGFGSFREPRDDWLPIVYALLGLIFGFLGVLHVVQWRRFEDAHEQTSGGVHAKG